MPAKLKTHTLGCKVNQYETQWVREGLLQAGFCDADESQPADLCLVNTCTVTAEGDSKSRQVIRRMNRENPGARIIVMGCYATRAPEEVAKLPGVVEVVRDKRELPDLLGRHGVIDVPSGICSWNGRQRAFVKVQDGCLLNCSYCIIPLVRPVMQSRPLDSIVAEIQRLEENGYREVVLTGIHLGHYGVDFNRGRARADWTRLATLVRSILAATTEVRLRLSSIEATEVTRDLVATMAENADRVCPHLHVCLQSGSDRILRRMRRRWSARQIIGRCEWVKAALSQPAFSTDVIVGFPGENEDDFQATLEVCREIGFMKIHAFPFSPRRGTAAASLPDPVPAELRNDRVTRLMELDADLRIQFLDSLIGRRLTVLIEQPAAEGWEGTSCRFVSCQVPPAVGLRPGRMIEIRAHRRSGQRLLGNPVESDVLPAPGCTLADLSGAPD